MNAITRRRRRRGRSGSTVAEAYPRFPDTPRVPLARAERPRTVVGGSRAQVYLYDPMAEALYIVDALNFLFRAFHALPPLTTTKGLATGAVYGLCQMLIRIERENQPSHLCAVFDAPGRTFRDDLYDAYKADRPPMPPELAVQVELVHRVIDTFRIPTLTLPGVEADDVIATLACQAAAGGLQVVICSSDKDLMQLCSEDIKLLDTMKNRFIGPAEVAEKFGVPPGKVGDVLALMGDSIDNVPGVAGIGPKTAAELINRFGSLTALLERVGEVKGKKGEVLAASRAAAEVSRKLVELRCDVPLPVQPEELRRVEPDRAELNALYRELEFVRLVTQDPLPGMTSAVAPRPVADATTEPPLAVSASPATPPAIVVDTAGLQALVADVRAPGRAGVAVLADGADSARAEFVGFALALPDGARAYVPVGHRLLGEPPSLRPLDALALLGPLFADAGVAKYVHDSKFLEAMLAIRGHAFAGVAADTLLAGYLLDASRTRYDLEVLAAAAGITGVVGRTTWLGSGRTARSGADVTASEAATPLATEAGAVLALGAVQAQRLTSADLLALYLDLELPLAHVLARIESHGIRLDREHLRRLGDEIGVTILALEQEIHRLAGTTFNIGSPKQLGEVLFGKLALPVVRRTKTGPSTDADVLEELATLHEVPAKIVEYRGLTKLKGTYIDALPALVNPRTGRLHTTFNQAVAATGRLSSSDPNLQNIPIRSEVGRRIREAFVADPGYTIVSADYSQIELRVLAHFSQDPAFLDAFRSGADIHQRTAAEVFGVAPEAVSGEQRRIAKAINFGLVFGQSDFGLAQAAKIPRATAKAYIASYFERYAGVRSYMERAISEARETGMVTTLLGRRRPIPEIASKRPQERLHAERVARNTPIQGSAADILKLAMIRVDAGLGTHWPAARLLLTVHDELVFEVPEVSVDSFVAWVRQEMESVHALRVPLIVDVGWGRTWGEAHR
jgi:DNA polymerase-1